MRERELETQDSFVDSKEQRDKRKTEIGKQRKKKKYKKREKEQKRR